jgi:hypothetical protein
VLSISAFITNYWKTVSCNLFFLFLTLCWKKKIPWKFKDQKTLQKNKLSWTLKSSWKLWKLYLKVEKEYNLFLNKRFQLYYLTISERVFDLTFSHIQFFLFLYSLIISFWLCYELQNCRYSCLITFYKFWTAMRMRKIKIFRHSR